MTDVHRGLDAISHVRRGSGTPVVLVHGLGSRWEVFEPIIDQVAERHDVLAIDLPGFGRTPADDSVSPGSVGYARWLARLLADAGIEAPHVVGSSMGGGIALELGRIGVASRVTAFSPVGFWQNPGRRWCQGFVTALRVAGKAGGPLLDRGVELAPVRAALVASLIGQPTRVPADAARLQLDGLVTASSFAAARDSFTGYRLDVGDDPGGLAEIPVTVAWGTRDYLLIHRSQSSRARAVLPKARHIDLVGCGHLPFSDVPNVCARLVLDDPEEWK
jgi:pimeloyl-ACP methyl ester carboxylesterase